MFNQGHSKDPLVLLFAVLLAFSVSLSLLENLFWVPMVLWYLLFSLLPNIIIGVKTIVGLPHLFAEI